MFLFTDISITSYSNCQVRYLNNCIQLINEQGLLHIALWKLKRWHMQVYSWINGLGFGLRKCWQGVGETCPRIFTMNNLFGSGKWVCNCFRVITSRYLRYKYLTLHCQLSLSNVNNEIHFPLLNNSWSDKCHNRRMFLSWVSSMQCVWTRGY